MDVEKVIDSILTQGPLVSFMGLVIYILAKYLKNRDDNREKRYELLIDKVLETSDQRTKTVVEALISSTEVQRQLQNSNADILKQLRILTNLRNDNDETR